MTVATPSPVRPVASPSPSPVDDPAISRSDLSELIAVSVLAPISWLLPQWLWVAAGRAISFAIAGIRPDVTRRRMRRLREALGPGPSDADLLALRVQIMSAYMEERLQILREYRPGGWRPRLRLVGREHLDAARAAGRGAMLMVCPFSYADLVVKKALHDAGFRVSHLSTFSRGFSPNSCHAWQPTRFGMSTLSRLRTRIEDRYLDERIIVPRSGGLGYLRQMEERLRGGGLDRLAGPSAPCRATARWRCGSSAAGWRSRAARPTWRSRSALRSCRCSWCAAASPPSMWWSSRRSRPRHRPIGAPRSRTSSSATPYCSNRASGATPTSGAAGTGS